MKKVKALLLIAVLTLTCVAFSGCSTDPKSLKGEEVNRLEWLTAFEYIANGAACQDKSASFKSYGTYNHYEVSSSDDDEEKELTRSMNYTLQVNKNVLYAELTNLELFNKETFEEKSYFYIDNNGKEELIYTSTDNVKWKQGSLSYISLGSLTNTINSLKNESHKFNKKNGMYESISTYGYTRIKFHNKKIVYVKVETEQEEVEVFFTDYDKTEIKQNEPKVEKNKLEIAYNVVKDSTNSYTNVSLSEDCSYMNFKFYSGYNEEDFESLNNALGLPNGSVVATMRETTDFNKRTTAKENGVIVTWVKVGENSNGGIYDVTYILE